MREVYIIDGVRTPIAKAGKMSWFANVRVDDLGAACLKALVQRNGIDPAVVEDVVWATCSNAVKEQGSNLGRITVFMAGFPYSVAGCTVDRFCASGIQSIQFAISTMMVGWADCVIAGGAQHMTRVPMGFMADRHPDLGKYIDINAVSMGYTAEIVAREWGISREAQDEFAMWSHQKAWKATQEGKFKREIVPIEADVPQKDETTKRMVVDRDQGIRPETTMESLAKLEPVFMKDEKATVTAGNSSQINDAAAAVLIMTKEKAQELGLKPRLKMLSYAVVGLDPRIMGVGPIYAIPKALARAGLRKEDIDVWEVNEAFASQCVAVQRELDLPKDRLNMWGSGISLGHPLACTGARMTTTLMNIMDDVDAKYGVVSMCVGHGQGVAAVFERIK
ncbi:MAG: thiolase family protein [Firmicutes bacterium]|nr:thiolase family protein [Bacillota bacterium]